MVITFRPQGTCSQEMRVRLDENNVIEELEVLGGCSGNLQGIARLVAGMDVDEAISRMEGVRCGYKSTSCPDQIAQALKEYKASQT